MVGTGPSSPPRPMVSSAAGTGSRRAPFDVTDPEAAAAGVAAVLADGPIDILVNNAGMQFRAPLEDFPVEKWQQLLTTNVSSIFYVSQPVARAHDRPRPRQDHQHRLGAERARPTRHRPLHRHQGRGPQPDARHGDRLGEARAAGQRHRARLLRDAAEPGAGRRPRLLRVAGEAHARRRAGARSRSWSAPRSSSPATPRPSSTATRSTSTAASPPASEREGTPAGDEARGADDRRLSRLGPRGSGGPLPRPEALGGARPRRLPCRAPRRGARHRHPRRPRRLRRADGGRCRSSRSSPATALAPTPSTSPTRGPPASA